MEERIRVLAVDADVAVLRQRARILEDRHGFDVDTAQSIQAAKERLNDSAQSIDCILYHAVTERIDDALEFISWVANRFPSIPTVFSTDVSIDSMPDEAFECGATAFIPAGKTTAPHNRVASRIQSLVTAQLESESPKDSGFVWLGGNQPDAPTVDDNGADTMQSNKTGDNQQIPPEAIVSIRKTLTADGDSTRSNRLVAFLLLEVLHRVREDSSAESLSASETHSIDELEAGYIRVVDRITTQGHQTDNADTVAAAIEPNRVLQIIEEEFPSVTGDAFSSLLGQLLDVQRINGSKPREITSLIDDTPVDEEEEKDPLLALVQTSLSEMGADVLAKELSYESEVAEEFALEDAAPSIESPPAPEVAQSDGGLLGLVEAAFSDPRAIDKNDKRSTASHDNADDSDVSESQFDTPATDDVPTETSDSISEDEDTPSSVASLVSAALSETNGNTDVAESSAENKTDSEAIGESPIEARDAEAISEYPIGEPDTEEIDVSALDEHDATVAGESAQEAHKSEAAGESTHHEHVAKAAGESTHDEHDTETIEESVIEETGAEEIEESDIAELEELTETEPNAVLNDITAEVSDDRLNNLSRDELLALVRDLTDSETQTGADQTASERSPEDNTTVTTTAEETTGDTAVADDSPESTSDVSTAEELSQPTDDSRQQHEDLGQPTDETRQSRDDLSQSTDESRQQPEDLSQSTDDRAQATGTTQTRNTADESAAMSQPDKSVSPDVDTQSTDPFDQFGSGQTEYDRPADLDLTPGDVVLVQCGSQDDRKQQACIDLLGVDDVADRNVLLVRYTEMNGPRLERIATHANRVTLVSVGYNQRVPQSVQQAVRTVNVTNPNDVTRLGIVITATLDNWSARDGETVVCFDPLNVLLRYKNVENVFRFLHILLGKLRSGNAISHFHVDPTAGDPQEINTLKPLFDSVLTIDSVGVSVEH